MSVGISGIRLWCARCVKLGGALALAIPASPNEVSSAILASADSMHLLDELMIMQVTIWGRYVSCDEGATYKAIEGYDLWMGLVAASAFYLCEIRM